MSLKFVRPRNKVVGSSIAGLACTLQGGRQTCGYVLTYTRTGFDLVKNPMDELLQSEGTREGAQ